MVDIFVKIDYHVYDDFNFSDDYKNKNNKRYILQSCKPS